MTSTVVGSGRNLLDNPGFRYGTRSWVAAKPTTPSVSGPAVASGAGETLVDGDVEPGGAARFPQDYVADGTILGRTSGTWSTPPARTAGKVAGVATGPNLDVSWWVQGFQFAAGERVTIRAAMRNPSAGGSPLGRLHLYPTDSNLAPIPGWDPAELDGSLLEARLADDGTPVRFDTELVLPPYPAGASSWVVAFGMTTNPGVAAGWPQGWELVEAHAELAPLAGNVLVFSPLLPTGQVAPRAWAKVSQLVPVVEGSRYSARGLVSEKNGLTSVFVQLETYGPDKSTRLRTVYSQQGPAQLGGPDLADWTLRTAELVVEPGEAFVAFAFVVATPDNVSGSWRARFDEAGLYEGALPAVWEPSGDADELQLDYPSVTIDDLRFDGVVRSASWRLGRSWWFAGPEAGTASLELAGDRAEVVPGSRVTIRGASPLFVGVVDDVLVDERATTDGVELVTRVTASDATAWLTGTKLAGVAFSGEPLAARLVALYGHAGATVTTRTMLPTTGIVDRPAETIGTAAAPVSALEELDRLERLSNAIAQLDAAGVLRLQSRAALPAGTTILAPELVGDDCPFDAQLDRASVSKVVNLWRFTDGEEAYTTAIPEGGTSAARYGVREYDTRLPKSASSRYASTMRAVVARALPSYRVAVSILRRSAPVLALGPFDYAVWRGDEWQLLELEHSVRPGRWELRLHLDATQDEIAPPAVPPPTPPVTPPTRLRATVTPAIAGDAYIVRTPSGLNAGNGAGSVILVGRLGDDNLARGLVEWAGMTFQGRNRRVVSATLTLTTRRDGCMQYGSSPKVKVLRVTGAWSQGSYGGSNPCAFGTANSVKYPGPSTTSSGAVSASVPAADGRSVAIRIDAIAQAWLDGAAQHGLELQGHTESSSSYRCGFSATGSTRAKLSITYEYEA